MSAFLKRAHVRHKRNKKIKKNETIKENDEKRSVVNKKIINNE